MTKACLYKIVWIQATRPGAHRTTAHRFDALELKLVSALSTLFGPPHAPHVPIDHTVAMTTRIRFLPKRSSRRNRTLSNWRR
jgi:hypothetical protein